MKFIAERELYGWTVENDGTELQATFDLEYDGRDYGLYATLHSYDPQRLHPAWADIQHKRIRITVEVID